MRVDLRVTALGFILTPCA